MVRLEDSRGTQARATGRGVRSRSTQVESTDWGSRRGHGVSRPAERHLEPLWGRGARRGVEPSWAEGASRRTVGSVIRRPSPLFGPQISWRSAPGHIFDSSSRRGAARVRAAWTSSTLWRRCAPPLPPPHRASETPAAAAAEVVPAPPSTATPWLEIRCLRRRRSPSAARKTASGAARPRSSEEAPSTTSAALSGPRAARTTSLAATPAWAMATSSALAMVAPGCTAFPGVGSPVSRCSGGRRKGEGIGAGSARLAGGLASASRTQWCSSRSGCGSR